MAQNINSGNVTATLNSNQINSVSLAKNNALYAQATASGTMLTVGAGKVARVLDIVIVGYTAGATGQISLEGAVAATTICLGSTSMIHRSWDYANAPQLVATDTITCVESGGSAWFGVSYILEDA